MGAPDLGTSAQTTITLKGSQFTAADIPAAKVVVSPDLTIKQDAKGIDVGGGVTLDSADVNLDKLPGAGATKASPDIVVSIRTAGASCQRAADQCAGQSRSRLQDPPDRHGSGWQAQWPAHGQRNTRTRHYRPGPDRCDGTYKAYGQNLQIERGQLLFASTPIDNPGLNIRAVRKINPNATIDEGQVVGLLIAGTAQRPIVTVFSNPVMEQSDALSYLITGKPLSDVKGGEGSGRRRCAGAGLGRRRFAGQADRIALGRRRYRRQSSSDALNGNSAFTVGKYLSPRLYLSYGVGLFESRPGDHAALSPQSTLELRGAERYRLQPRQPELSLRTVTVATATVQITP
jgi:translocation and assembly module TamB